MVANRASGVGGEDGGHENIETTGIDLHADMTLKPRAIDRTTPINTRPGRYQPPDKLIAFLEAI